MLLMTVSAALLSRFVVSDSTDNADTDRRDISNTIATVSILKFETVTLSNGFTALSPPTGAQHVTIEPVSGAFTYTLKGIEADTGVKWSTTAIPAAPISMALGSTPSIGLQCTGAGVVRVFWL